MIFGRRNTNSVQPATANSVVNKLVTYGLIAFVLFAMYNSNTGKSKTPVSNGSVAELNYTPIEFGNYVRIKNLATGEEGYQKIDELDGVIRLSVTNEALKKLKTSQNGSIPVFEIEINTTKTANIFAPR